MKKKNHTTQIANTQNVKTKYMDPEINSEL